MDRLYEENITGEVLKHMTHSEDLVFFGGKGCGFMLDSFDDIYDTLKGNTPSGRTRITTKWDGSPAAVAASDFHGRKFVALKHSWDKGKVFDSPQAIDLEYGDRPELADKLKSLLSNLDFIGIPKDEVWMGDYLFSKDDLRVMDMDGEECVTFQPNTIVYAIPLTDIISGMVRRADIGIVWHTRYRGEDFQNLRMSFDVSVDEVNSVPTVFQADAKLPDIAGKLTMTDDETENTGILMDRLHSDVDKLTADPGYDEVLGNAALTGLIQTYRNSIIKDYANGNQFPNLDGFVKWVTDRYNKEKETKKTDKGRNAVEERLQALLTFIREHEDTLRLLWDVQKQAVVIKEFFEGKLNSVSHLKTFVHHVEKGYLPTSGEGYAVSDVDGNIQKIVSRLEFSRNNFDNRNILKGWTSEKRVSESLIKKFREEMSAEKTEIYNDVKNDLLDPNDIRVKPLKGKDPLNGRKDPYKMYVMPNDPGESRVETKRKLVASNQIENMPNDGTTPRGQYTTPEGSHTIEIQFKDNYESTEAFEGIWAQCLYEELNQRDCTELARDLTETALLSDKPGWEDSFIRGSKYMSSVLGDGSDEWYVFRLGESFPPGVQSIHTMINRAARGKGSKDSWNPSDIYICKKSAYEQFVRQWMDMMSKDPDEMSPYNSILLDYLNRGEVIGISLKKIGTKKSPVIDRLNTDISEKADGDEKDGNRNRTWVIKNSTIQVPSTEMEVNASKGMSFDIVSNDGINATVQYRRFDSKHPSIQMEITSKGSSARLGKTPVRYLAREISNLGIEYIGGHGYSKRAKNDIVLNREMLDNMMRKVLESDLIVKDSNGRIMTIEGWTRLSSKMEAIMKNDLANGDVDTVNYIEGWPSMIRLMYALATSPDRSGLIGTFYDKSEKKGSEFAPYIRIRG